MIEHDEVLNIIKNLTNNYQTICKEIIKKEDYTIILKLLRNGNGDIKIVKSKINKENNRDREEIYYSSDISLKETVDFFNEELKKYKKNNFSLLINNEIIVSEFAEKNIIHEDDICLECLFVFNENSKGLKKLKEIQFGGKVFSDGSVIVKLNNENFEVLGFGADGDNNDSVSFFFIKEKNIK